MCIPAEWVVPVMRVTVLRAPKGGDAGGMVAYYAGLAEDQLRRDGLTRGPVDYYLDPDEPPGHWSGPGRHALGLDGAVHPDEVAALLEGRHPKTGERLGRRFRDRGVRAFDATFSAPKSVSVLWGLSDDPAVRAEVLAAHDAAVEAALGWFGRHGAVTRRGTDGLDQVDTKGVTAAVFRQHTSRAIDPQLHTHALIFAKVQDRTGKWLSLDARFLTRQQRAIGWIYDAALRVELSRRLEVEWGPVIGGQADLQAIPPEVLELFSQRTHQTREEFAGLVREWIDEHDGEEPNRRTVARLERKAVLRSRPEKEHGLDPASLHREWRGRALEIGFDLDVDVETVSLEPGHGDTDEDAELDWDGDAILDEAMRRVGERSATWLEADLAREIATMLPPDAMRSGEALCHLIDELARVAMGRCLELHPPGLPEIARRVDGRPVSEHVTDRRLTTSEILDQEARLYRWARTTATPTPAVTLTNDEGLGTVQADAAKAVAGTAKLALVVGPAGSGKTTSLSAAVATLHTHNRPVIALAPTGKAADVLAREVGCETATLAKLLTRYQHPARIPPRERLPVGTTLIVDEASMVTTDDLDRLVTLARREGWRLALVGDPHQLPAIGRAGMFADLTEALPAVHLKEVRRFDHSWEADASLQLRAGDPAAVDTYQDHGRVEAVHPDLVAERVARHHETVTRSGQEVAITTTRVETARAINLAIQHRRRHLRGLERSARLRDQTRAFVGDRVATRRNHRDLETSRGIQVRNRQTWTVEIVHDDGSLTIGDAERGSIRLPAPYVARHVELGWAVTGYGNQGISVDHGICIVEPGTARADLYVAMTRGRASNTALVPTRDPHEDPAEVLARIIEQPPRALTAHAMRRKLHEQQGLDIEEPALEIEEPELEPEPPSLEPDPPDDSVRAQANRMRERLNQLERDLARRDLERKGPGLDIA